MSRASLSFLGVLLMASASAVASDAADLLQQRQAESRKILQDALAHVNDIEIAGDRNWAMQAIGLALVAAGDETGAAEVDKKVETGEVPRPILKAIAQMQFSKGKTDDAIVTVRAMKDQDGCNLTLIALAEQADDSGDPEMAARLCQLVTGQFRLESLLLAARIEARAADEEGSSELLNAAKLLAVRQPEVAKVAVTEALLGNIDHAARLLGRLRREHDRSNVFAAMVSVEAAAKDFENADAYADSIYDDDLKAISLGRIAMGHAKVGQIKQAIEGLSAIFDDDVRIDFQHSLTALELQRHGIVAGHDVATAVSGDAAKAVCLSQVAVAATLSGKMQEAHSALDEAKAVLARPRTSTPDVVFAAFAENMSRMDKLTDAMEIAGRITDSMRRSAAIRQIMRTATTLHDVAAAQKLMESITDPRDRALAQVGIAEGAVSSTAARNEQQ